MIKIINTYNLNQLVPHFPCYSLFLVQDLLGSCRTYVQNCPSPSLGPLQAKTIDKVWCKYIRSPPFQFTKSLSYDLLPKWRK